MLTPSTDAPHQAPPTEQAPPGVPHPFHDRVDSWFINLDKRPDRRAQVERHLRACGWPSARFAALEDPLGGAVGCTRSHCAVLRAFLAQPGSGADRLCLVLEDDVVFPRSDLLLQAVRAFLYLRTGRDGSEDDWDVLLLGAANAGPLFLPPAAEAGRLPPFCARLRRAQTTTAYLVRGAYVPTLLANMEDGLARLQAHPDQRAQFAVDRHWFPLQAQDRWFLLLPPACALQRPDFSDIEQREVDYRQVMLRPFRREE